MNPLTQVKNTQKITAREAALGITEAGSWHAKYKDSAYIYAGNFSFDLTEGDLLAIFAQYGEIVDLNLVRDKGTGKSRGFAFLAYEDQRSTILAVDNLNGANIVGRTIKVDHVAKYKKKTEEDEEEEQRKREERGVCHAFQRGECNRGSSCKFSHDEKRSADTGWGSKDDAKRWTHDRYDGGSRQPYSRSRDEDCRRRDAQSRAREKQGTRGENPPQDREHTENRSSGFHSERESTVSSRKRHHESRSHTDKDHWHRDTDNRRGHNESRRERGSREMGHQSRDWDDRKDTSHHPREDAQHRRGNVKDSQLAKKRFSTDEEDVDGYHTTHNRGNSHSDKDRRDNR